VKFGVLWRRAVSSARVRLATGHYARIGVDRGPGRAALRTARDAAKDQTYFLFALGHATSRAPSFPSAT
jgi:tRNA-specific 2-thiouridylase